MQLEEAAIRVDGARSRDDPESVLGEARHRHVADDSAALVEELRVRDRPDRAVDACAAHALEHVELRELELPEGGHVEDPRTLAHRGVLDREAVVPRRPHPAAGLALFLPGRARRVPRLVPVGALPAVLRPEDGAERFVPRVKRGEPLRPARLGHVQRVPQPVVVLVDLAPARGREGDVSVWPAEAPRPVRLDVHLGLAGGDELGQRLPEPSSAAEAVQRQPRREPETAHAGHRAEQRIPVGRHRVGMADEPRHACLVEEREAPHRACHQLREALVVGRQRTGAVIPRHAVLPA